MSRKPATWAVAFLPEHLGSRIVAPLPNITLLLQSLSTHVESVRLASKGENAQTLQTYLAPNEMQQSAKIKKFQQAHRPPGLGQKEQGHDSSFLQIGTWT